MPNLENFKPVLRTNVERFELPEGDAGLCDPKAGTYLRVAKGLSILLDCLDGTRSLTKLAIHAGSQGMPLSTRALLGMLDDLARGGWLENGREYLELAPVRDSDRPESMFLKFLKAPVLFRLTSRGLGRLKQQVLTPFKYIRLNAGFWVALALAGVAAAMAGILLADLELPGDPLWFHGKYWLGLLTVYCGAVFGLSVRELFRAWVLGGEGVTVFAAGIISRAFVLGPYLDDRDIFRAGRRGELRLRLSGLAGAAVALGVLLIWMMLNDEAEGQQLFYLAALGAGIVLYGVLCPFINSDLGRLIDLLAPKGEGRKHAWNYLQRRVFRRLGTTRSFEGEAFYIVVSLTMVAWVYLGFHFATIVVRSVLHTIARLPLRETGPVDQVLVFGVLVLAGLVAMIGILALVAGVFRAVIKNVPERTGRPLEDTSDKEPVRDLLKSCPLFAHLEDQALGELAGQAKKLGYRAGQLVIRQGDEGDEFFVIMRGEVAILVTEDSGLEWAVAFLGPGDAFGEMALLEYGRRTASVRAESDLTLVSINRENFMYALGEGSVPLSKVTALLRATQTMRGSAVFNAMSPGALARVVGLARRETRKEGDVIIQEGEPGDSFYVIETGAASVTHAGVEEPVARLGPGDFFGEIALLNDAPRTATVTCIEPCALLVLDRQGFYQVMAHDFAVGSRLEKVALARSHSG